MTENGKEAKRTQRRGRGEDKSTKTERRQRLKDKHKEEAKTRTKTLHIPQARPAPRRPGSRELNKGGRNGIQARSSKIAERRDLKKERTKRKRGDAQGRGLLSASAAQGSPLRGGSRRRRRQETHLRRGIRRFLRQDELPRRQRDSGLLSRRAQGNRLLQESSQRCHC